MADENPKKLCLVIGRMGTRQREDGTEMNYLDRLRVLAQSIIAPILEPYGYTIEIPLAYGARSIPQYVVQQLDRADIVVADITGSNPNVMYELGIRHGIGLPYVVVTEDATEKDVPFDIRSYFYTKFDSRDIEFSQRVLEPALLAAHKDVLQDNLPKNPVTDYYGAALTEISPAPGLALGYWNNFITKVALNAYEADYELIIDNTVQDENVKKKIPIILYKPQRIRQTNPENIRQLVLEGKLLEVELKSENKSHRKFTFYALPDKSCLVDIPTTVGVLKQTLEQRLSSQADRNSIDWLRLEEQEIDRFFAVLSRLISREEREIILSRLTVKDFDIR